MRHLTGTTLVLLNLIVALWSRVRRILGSSRFCVLIYGWGLIACLMIVFVIIGARTSPGNVASSFFFVIVVGWNTRLGGHVLAKGSYHYSKLTFKCQALQQALVVLHLAPCTFTVGFGCLAPCTLLVNIGYNQVLPGHFVLSSISRGLTMHLGFEKMRLLGELLVRPRACVRYLLATSVQNESNSRWI
jgi:hypothetical protein